MNPNVSNIILARSHCNGEPAGSRLLMVAMSLLVATVVLFSATACGSDPGVGSGGTGITGSQLGTVTGFGSIVVENNRYDDQAARVSLEAEPALAIRAENSGIQLGMQVHVQFDRQNRATDIRVRPQLIGSVDQASSTTLTVAGQQVGLNLSGVRATVFEGFEDPQALLNRQVVVYGQFDANGALRATRVELRRATLLASTLVTGFITQTPAADTLRIGNLLVKITTLTRRLPANAVFRAGDLVSVWALRAPDANNQLTVASIRLEEAPSDLATTVRAGGLIRAVSTVPGGGPNTRQIQIGSLSIDVSNATVRGGAISDLQSGVVVRVVGQYQATLVVAQQVEIVDDASDQQREIAGLISDFFSATSFRVRGVQIDASGTGVTFNNGTIDNLADRVAIRVRGRQLNGIVVADEVTFLFNPRDASQSLVGGVSNYQQSAGTFTLFNIVNARVSTQTTFEDTAGEPVAPDQFGSGDLVRLDGNFVAGVFVANKVTFISTPGDLPRNITGIAYRVDLAARTLTVGRVQISWDGLTQIDGNINDLTFGTLVKVTGNGSGSGLIATRLQILADN